MKRIEIRGTLNTPKIILDPRNGSIKMLGRSTMTCPQEFYPSIIKMLEEYCKAPAEKTQLIIDLQYYNTLSARYLLSILKMVTRIRHNEGFDAKIFWFYDDTDSEIKDDIKLFSESIGYKIHAIEYELA